MSFVRSGVHSSGDEVPSTYCVSQSETRKVSKGQFFALAAWQGEVQLAIVVATYAFTSGLEALI